MMRAYCGACLLLAVGMLNVLPGHLRAQGAFELVTGKEFDSAVPKDFYLEGNAIPTEKRNAVLLKNPGGGRILLALIDTSGYSSEIRQKYIGMLIAEGRVSICGAEVGVGSYGFGLDKPAGNSSTDATFHLYNQAGEKVTNCSAQRDPELQQPKPLQVIIGSGGLANLYLGRYRLELR